MHCLKEGAERRPFVVAPVKKPRRRVKPADPPLAPTPAIDAEISRHEAVVRITQRVRRPDEDERQARNRVSKRITYARNAGLIAEASPRKFAFGAISRWAKSEWPGLFLDWPAHIEASSHSAASAMTSADAVALPGTLARCHALIEILHSHLATLQSELASAREEIELLRPKAAEWEKLCQRNQQSARKPRK